MGAAAVDGRPVAVTGGDDSYLRAWRILSGEQIGTGLYGVEPAVDAIAITERSGRAIAVTGSCGDPSDPAEGETRGWDLSLAAR